MRIRGLARAPEEVPTTFSRPARRLISGPQAGEAWQQGGSRPLAGLIEPHLGAANWKAWVGPDSSLQSGACAWSRRATHARPESGVFDVKVTPGASRSQRRALARRGDRTLEGARHLAENIGRVRGRNGSAVQACLPGSCAWVPCAAVSIG